VLRKPTATAAVLHRLPGRSLMQCSCWLRGLGRSQALVTTAGAEYAQTSQANANATDDGPIRCCSCSSLKRLPAVLT
jgi:hypothetical protein